MGGDLYPVLGLHTVCFTFADLLACARARFYVHVCVSASLVQRLSCRSGSQLCLRSEAPRWNGTLTPLPQIQYTSACASCQRLGLAAHQRRRLQEIENYTDLALYLRMYRHKMYLMPRVHVTLVAVERCTAT